MIQTLFLIIICVCALFFLIKEKDFQSFLYAVIISSIFIVVWKGLDYAVTQNAPFDFKFYASFVLFNYLLLIFNNKSKKKIKYHLKANNLNPYSLKAYSLNSCFRHLHHHQVFLSDLNG